STGLLDHCEATTHWAATRLIQAAHPEINLKPERVLVSSGPDQRIITSGGSSSWEDLALYLISRYCGPTEAIRATKIFLLGDRSEGQLLFAALLLPKQHDDAIIADCQAWLAMNYHEMNPVGRMIARSGLTDRTFKRRFQAATGYSPMDYAQTLRIEEAKQSLESDDSPIDDIAHSIGYQDPAFFRRLFKKRTGVTPGRYRQRYQTFTRYSGDL
ncbi:GlxA family transcriptional regulator, partial [Sneathiella sp.]|uniref:GlxA family transcriptional regulator n=1 Tax=Sneathiella sp. TaxID=1964365 RepID=UPI00260FD80A